MSVKRETFLSGRKAFLKLLLCFALFLFVIADSGLLRAETFSGDEFEAEQVLASILKSAPTGVGVVKHRMIVKVNDYILKLTGYSREELIGQSARMLYPTDEDSEYVGREKYLQIKAKGTGSVETRWLRKDGTIRNVILSSTPLDPDDLSVGVTFTVLDITDRKHAEERFSKAFQASPVSLVVTDRLTGRIIAVNKSFEKIIGFSQAEMLGKTTLELNIWPKAEDREKLVTKLAKNGFVKDLEVSLCAKGGIFKQTIVFVEIIDWEEKEAMLTSILDVTEYRKTQAMLAQRTNGFILVLALLILMLLILVGRLYQSLKQREIVTKESETRRQILDTLLDNLPIGVFMVEAFTGKPQVANNKAQELLGRGILPDATAENLGEVYQAFITGTNNPYPVEKMPIVRGMQGEESFIDDMTVVRPDGSETQLEIFGTPVYDSDGKVVSSIVSFLDISDRRKTEQALRESEQTLSTLFTSMTEMVVMHELVFDEKGKAINYRITDCNAAFTKVTGITRESALGKTAENVYGTEAPPYFEEFLMVVLSSKTYSYETYFAPMDKYFSISVVCTGNNKFATVTSDITAMKQHNEIITTKNRELENYLYVASHDLRTPLVNIQGFSKRLQKNVDAIKNMVVEKVADESLIGEIAAISDEEIPRTLGFIFTNVSKMDALLKGLLQISRTGRLAMNIVEIDMEKLVKELVGAQEFQLAEINAEVEIGRLENCYGDADLLARTFTNLIANAIKYRDIKRSLKIKITSETQFSRVIYMVKDNGSGIEQRHLEKIWDVFFRVDSTRPDAGEGLGLSIVKRIVEKHLGRVWAESETGVGTTFFVELQQRDFSEL